MIHFVKQIQYFSHLDVIECSWVALMRFVDKGEGDLDALIDAHTSYINRLAAKALLRVSTRRAHNQEETIMNGVKEAFKLALNFKDTLDALCNYALAEASKLHDTRSRHPVCTNCSGSTRTSHLTLDNPNASQSTQSSSGVHGEVGSPQEQTQEQSDSQQLSAMRERLRHSTSQFQEVVQGLVATLASHSDLDLRFLSCRINFSLFYLVGKARK